MQFRKITISPYSDHRFIHETSHDTNLNIDDSRHRRHSVGTFASKDKILTTSFIDEPPLEEAPRAPTSHYRRNMQQRGEFSYLLNRLNDRLKGRWILTTEKNLILLNSHWICSKNRNNAWANLLTKILICGRHMWTTP